MFRPVRRKSQFSFLSLMADYKAKKIDFPEIMQSSVQFSSFQIGARTTNLCYVDFEPDYGGPSYMANSIYVIETLLVIKLLVVKWVVKNKLTKTARKNYNYSFYTISDESLDINDSDIEKGITKTFSNLKTLDKALSRALKN